MKLTSRKFGQDRKIELSMTSMIDVVFLLLIFFMVTASFVKTERNLDSSIKLKEKSSSASSQDLEPAIIEVVKAAGGVVFRLGGRDLTSTEDLTAVLKQFPNKSDGAFVRVSDDVPFGKAAAAIQACKSADFKIVSYVPLD